MPRILLTGITSCESRGVEALARSLTTALTKTPDTSVTVLTQTPALDAEALSGTGADCAPDPWVVSRSWATVRPVETEQHRRARAERLLQHADLVLATGGDLHTSDYGVSTAYLAVLDRAQQLGIPTAMIGQSVGPFTNPAEQLAFTTTATGLDLLTVRESTSRTYLTEQLALPADRVALSADPAFLLQPSGSDRAQQLLADAGLGAEQAYICLVPSRGVTRYSTITDTQHLDALTSLADTLWRVRRRPLVLVPHCHDSREHNDDRILARQIAARLPDVPVHVLDAADTRASDYKAVLGGAELVISERLHASIGALSSGTPAVAIGHSPKFHGVLADTYGPGVPATDVHRDVAAFVADPSAVEQFAHLDTSRLRAHLATRLSTVVALATEDITRVRALLNS
ncbi:polysaccharide pyruvyl transferase family protein [Streptomyces sp. NBC_00102]|uniref:polysaccharide pyruvyl transferase family protein n=1 Tax=Streptomyces sp. NBC_00102 TaxID=2975652 RepID=UPI002256724A|nr:polysaccharide pyruvyl transferase family protein [Streptomyces sp. NBC_00102]MCX5397192.1 polysaccharide pyruvyl transferase family protein [Streptomyces sp. NBC_00102]